jgi:hypothetical protein
MWDTPDWKLVVWDPITGDHTVLPGPDRCWLHTRSGTVLCAVAGCDHRDCHGGPFTVVFVAFVSTTNMVTRAWIYSSETAAWSPPATVQFGRRYFLERNHGAIVGNGFYFLLNLGTAVLKFDLGKHCLSVISSPLVHSKPAVLMPTEDGSLGLAWPCLRI